MLAETDGFAPFPAHALSGVPSCCNDVFLPSIVRREPLLLLSTGAAARRFAALAVERKSVEPASFDRWRKLPTALRADERFEEPHLELGMAPAGAIEEFVGADKRDHRPGGAVAQLDVTDSDT